MKRIHSFLLPAALVLLLSACGGGSDPTPDVVVDPLAEVPASASQSTAAMASYMHTLAISQAETRDPLAVEAFSPPKPDDTEPEPTGG
jgi:hypothetical protein